MCKFVFTAMLAVALSATCAAAQSFPFKQDKSFSIGGWSVGNFGVGGWSPNWAFSGPHSNSHSFAHAGSLNTGSVVSGPPGVGAPYSTNLSPYVFDSDNENCASVAIRTPAGSRWRRGCN